ncbi:DMT family transporter [Aminicella lysinilytica]|uniref:DMT family transporter n=1 Tax=Aminicella lysinilytica TaxID=433323 RepID=UPI0026EF86D2|nr:DMT family transporter [Aminicella lysinilytica]
MKKSVIVYIVMTAFFFSTMNVALKIAGADIDPLELTYIRFLIGGLILLPLGIMELRKNHVRLNLRDLGYLLILGIICIPVSMLFFQYSCNHMNASTSAVLFCINPLFTMLFACTMSNEIFTNRRLVAVVVSLAGFVFMVQPWNMQAGNTLSGALSMLLAAIFFSLYSVLGKKNIKRIGTFAQTSLAFIFGSLVLMVIVMVTGRPLVAGVADNLPAVLYVGIAVTGIGYLAYFLAIKNSDATTASIAFFLKPAIAPIVAVIVMGDVLLWNSFVGIGLILVASFLNMRESKRCAELKAKGEPVKALIGNDINSKEEKGVA